MTHGKHRTSRILSVFMIIMFLFMCMPVAQAAIDTTDLVANIYANGQATGGVTTTQGVYQQYSYQFTASQNSTSISFLFRHDPDFFAFDDVSVKLQGGGPELVLNGGFEFVDGSNNPDDWAMIGTQGLSSAGVVSPNTPHAGSKCWYDGAVNGFDGFQQYVATVPGQTYDVTFYLNNSGWEGNQAPTTDPDSSNSVSQVLLYVGGLPSGFTITPPANATYTVTYDGNSNDSGNVPTDAGTYANGAQVTVLGNTGTLARTGYTFAGWNTQAGGGGTSYAPADTFNMGSANVTLYARWTQNATYTVTYDGNSNDSGNVPTDAGTYANGAQVTVLGNTGTLARTGYTFAGWNTQAGGGGTSYAPADTFNMGSANVTLYARWTQNATYTVTYDGNSNDSGNVPTDAGTYANGAQVTVLGNTGTLARTGYTFAGWNTQAGGGGTSYAPAATFNMGSANVTLYARWTQNATYTVTYDGNSNDSGNVPTDAGTYANGAQVTVLGNTGTLARTGYTFAGWNTQAGGGGTSYAPAATFNMGSANVTLYARWTQNATYTVTYDGNSNDSGNVPTDAGTYANGAQVTVLGNTGTLARTGYTFAGWNTQAGGGGTSYAPADTFNMGSANVTLYARWNVVVNNTPAPPPTPEPDAAIVIVNGVEQKIGTTTSETVGDKNVVTVAVDEQKINEKLASEGMGSTVVIPVQKNSDVVVGQLSGQTVKNMESKEAVLEIRTENVTYTLPASQIDIDTVSEEIGAQVELKDIKVNISIAEPPEDTVKVVENTASRNNYQVVVQPVDFNISCTSGNKTVDVTKFNGYVERTVAIPDGVDPSKITTGIVLNADGTFSHVPTTVIQTNGKYFAKINSLTNSTYTIVYSPKTFQDTLGHWSDKSVSDMASRLIISGRSDSVFDPDAMITRGEFATVIVKALGLMRPGTGKAVFADVKAGDWYFDAVSIAADNRLLGGYDDGLFHPEKNITREEAMSILTKAALTTKKVADIKSADTASLTAFADSKTISGWADTSVRYCVINQLIQGTDGKIAATDNLTRAQAAAMVKNLLKKAGLI